MTHNVVVLHCGAVEDAHVEEVLLNPNPLCFWPLQLFLCTHGAIGGIGLCKRVYSNRLSRWDIQCRPSHIHTMRWYTSDIQHTSFSLFVCSWFRWKNVIKCRLMLSDCREPIGKWLPRVKLARSKGVFPPFPLLPVLECHNNLGSLYLPVVGHFDSLSSMITFKHPVVIAATLWYYTSQRLNCWRISCHSSC